MNIHFVWCQGRHKKFRTHLLRQFDNGKAKKRSWFWKFNILKFGPVPKIAWPRPWARPSYPPLSAALLGVNLEFMIWLDKILLYLSTISIWIKSIDSNVYIIIPYCIKIRRSRGDLIETFKILTGREELPPERFFEATKSDSTRGHECKLYRKATGTI